MMLTQGESLGKQFLNIVSNANKVYQSVLDKYGFRNKQFPTFQWLTKVYFSLTPHVAVAKLSLYTLVPRVF